MKIRRVTDLNELIGLSPLFEEGYDAMNKRGKVFSVDKTGFILRLLQIFNNQPRNGILVVFDEDKPIGYGAGYDISEDGSRTNTLLLWALYVKKEYSGNVVVDLFERCKEEALTQGYDNMIAFNSRLNGAMFRLFEQKLGMKRKSVEFEIKLK